MNLEHPKFKAYQALREDVNQLTIPELIVLNGEVLTNYTFSDESKVRKLIETHLPDDPFHLSLVALTNILLSVTNQRLIQWAP